MKKFLTAVAAAVMLCTTCIGFAACKEENAEDIAGEEVTEEQWKAALCEEAFSNVKIEYKFDVDGDIGTYLMTVVGNEANCKFDDGSELYEKKTEPDSILVYGRNSQNAEWRKGGDEVVFHVLPMQIIAFESRFSEFKFDADKKAYVMYDYDSDGVTVADEFQFKFQEGKLKACVWNSTYAGNVRAVFAYGGQSINRPSDVNG